MAKVLQVWDQSGHWHIAIAFQEEQLGKTFLLLCIVLYALLLVMYMYQYTAEVIGWLVSLFDYCAEIIDC